MSVIINIENYEAFYLDYLEGNLNETDTAALLLFLQAHPELAWLDEDLPVLAPQEEQLDASAKQQMRVFDPFEKLSAANSEQFMIAQMEGLLDAKQERELENLLAANPAAAADFKLYQLTQLRAETVVYPYKNKLKQTRVIPMVWRYAAAACVVGAIAMSYLLSPADLPVASSSYLGAKFTPKNVRSLVPKALAVEGLSEKSSTFPEPKAEQSKTTVGTLPALAYTRIDVPGSERVPGRLLLTPVQATKQREVESTNDNSFVSIAEMKNPIKPITNGIKNRFNREVDFRTAKANSRKQGGFYLKIGRFEITRKVAPTDASLASN